MTLGIYTMARLGLADGLYRLAASGCSKRKLTDGCSLDGGRTPAQPTMGRSALLSSTPHQQTCMRN